MNLIIAVITLTNFLYKIGLVELMVLKSVNDEN